MKNKEKTASQSAGKRYLLVVEDDRDLASNLIDFFEVCGYEVDYASDGQSALALADENDYDLILLDLSLPWVDGLSVCRELRGNQGCTTPIVILTANGDVDTKVSAFDIGADDYLVKPASLKELEARVRALIRRRQRSEESTVLRVGDLVFDTGTLQVERAGIPITLARVPATILRILMTHSPNVVHRLAIGRELWGEEDHSESHALIVHIHALRSAIDKPFEHQLIHTIRGVGYRIACDDITL